MQFMTQYDFITYSMLIDGKENKLTFSTQNRNRHYCYNDNEHGGLHMFPYPLATYPLNKPFKANNHEYVILKKP